MNRLESIKSSNEKRKKLMMERKNEYSMMRELEYNRLVDKSVEDMDYLIQRLEIAQKALEGVVNVIHVQGVNRDIGEQSQWDEALLFKVREALDQLKE